MWCGAPGPSPRPSPPAGEAGGEQSLWDTGKGHRSRTTERPSQPRSTHLWLLSEGKKPLSYNLWCINSGTRHLSGSQEQKGVYHTDGILPRPQGGIRLTTDPPKMTLRTLTRWSSVENSIATAEFKTRPRSGLQGAEDSDYLAPATSARDTEGGPCQRRTANGAEGDLVLTCPEILLGVG